MVFRSSTTAQDALHRATTTFRLHDIEDPDLEAEVLLRHVLQLDRAYLVLRLPDTLTPAQEQDFSQLVAKRLAHTPTAYLTGRREFYSLSFAVAPGVLIPRPETEHLVDAALTAGRRLLAERGRATMVDVGTGSGAIALTVAKHLPALRVLAVDISPQALTIAELNARRLRLAGRVTFLHGDLLDPVTEPVDLIAANLPYIPTDVWAELPPEIREHEPRLALDGGPDGLTLIDRLLHQAADRLTPGGSIMLEVAHDQAAAVRDLAEARLPAARAEVIRDLAGHERIVLLSLG